MSHAKFAHDVEVARRSRARLARIFARIAVGATVGPVALAMIAGAARVTLGIYALGQVALAAWLLGWLVAVPLAALAALIVGHRYRLRADRVEVDDSGLTLLCDGREIRSVARREMTGALSGASGARDVEIVLSDGDLLQVELPAADAARALVDALGFGASERRTVVHIGANGPLAAGCAGVILAVIVSVVATCGMVASAPARFVDHFGLYFLGALFVGASVLFTRLFAPKRIIVGTDGVLVEKSFGDRFVPLASIVSVDVTDRGLCLAVTGPETATIVLTSDTGQRARALCARIGEALSSATRAGEEATIALLSRGGRSLEEWREALRKLMGEGGYRGPSVPMDALVRAVESADTPAEERLGAAMAIGLLHDAAARQKVRIAAEGIANEKVRVAMEAAAEGEAIDEAIFEQIAEEQRAVAG